MALPVNSASAVLPAASDSLQGMVVANSAALPAAAVHVSNHNWWADRTALTVYAIAALLVVTVVWWLVRRSGAWVRAIVRGRVTAFAFSPAILACGSVAIMPFPALLWGALRNPDAASCGAPLVALPPNAMTFAGLWLLLTLTLWLWGWFRQPSPTTLKT